MKRSEILQSAEKCVCGDRQEDYGSPEDNFAVIANLWTAYKKQEFTPLDVAMMMVLLKVARVAGGRVKDDSFIDGAGYFSCAGEIATEKEKIIGICDGLYVGSDGAVTLGGENGNL